MTTACPEAGKKKCEGIKKKKKKKCGVRGHFSFALLHHILDIYHIFASQSSEEVLSADFV